MVTTRFNASRSATRAIRGSTGRGVQNARCARNGVTMAFMSVSAAHGLWAIIDTTHGTNIVPAEFLDRQACEDGDFESCDDYIEGGEVNSVLFQDGWCARLSAPGCMDCTSWDGPYASEEKARASVRTEYECDDNGDSEDEDTESADDGSLDAG